MVVNSEHLAGTHDLIGLPLWGPYTKTYMGISHIADAERGIRFDLSVFPGFYRRKVDVPNVMWESGYHPWEASPDLAYFAHRHELEWKDRVYADIAYAAPGTGTTAGAGENVRLIRCKLANRTDMEQNAVLHFMASLHLPQVRPHGEALQTVGVRLPEGAVWVDALDYAELAFAVPRPSDRLVYDGFYRAEVRAQRFVGGSAVGAGFGRDPGDRAVYRVHAVRTLEQAVLLLRYRLPQGESAAFALEIAGGFAGELRLEGGGDAELAAVPLGRLEPGEHTVSLVSAGGSARLELDGFAIAEERQCGQVAFVPDSRCLRPRIETGPAANSLLLQYEGVDHVYGLLWQFADFEIREFHCSELDRFMRHTVHHHVHSVFKDESGGDGHFTNVFLRPIPLAPQSSRTVYGMVCAGSRDEVLRRLAAWNGAGDRYAAAFQEAETGAARVDRTANEGGKRYALSQRLMAATLLTNVVYPVYTKRSYIRHNTPGRWWDCLYTWDSGFIGLGLSELDTQRAVECLNAYVTEPGDPHAAFIHHGSMVPVQHYLFLELWNKTQSQELLAYFYPRLREYYLFYAGKSAGSTTSTLKSGLLKTWDYFYNSGGWDDYPPQVHVHREKLTETAAPVSNTCHAVRIAKILKMAAAAIGGLDDHIGEYERDIAAFAESVQRHAWDEEAGYFGYVLHDEAGQPAGLLRHESGQNYNMGLDGIYPLVAGIATADQERRMVGRIQDPSRLWSRIGLSTVDQSAAYYRADGYWNGAVWMPHQWFFWKALLGLGEIEAARRIARTALDLWQAETEATYNCYEHFIVQSGRGAGWHHFGGLSAPVLGWFAAYHRPGTLTCGFDVWAERAKFSEDCTALTADLRYCDRADRMHAALVCMAPGYRYRAKWNGREISPCGQEDGMLEMLLPGEDGQLTVETEA
ncbi:MGH1-like glycoside hydrolase domain-containing protein [Paenibacillus hamazuiensis]|uniref:MGH1-like glycoside hydrolase domain-containing protein n=1 Tax=Paenibacillus hamazuiensis TaxID=2936508 RepID=UPI00200C900D|nr:trehalase family glycosidase [Paenibacillus hamazuiensis]